MPKKIRELKRMLTKAGFTQRTGKGSHTNWFHPLYSGRKLFLGKTVLMLRNTKKRMF